MKNTFKSILAAMLTLAITLTSVLTGDPIAAQAKSSKNVEDATNLAGTTITMKSGDIKKVDIQKTYEKSGHTSNETDYYSWESSNDNVVRIIREYGYAALGGDLMIARCALVAEKTGTAVITATDPNGNTVSFTINVTTPKKTAKQLKCRHKWITTKKANCFWPGVKTCKKCKLQKSIKRTDHKYVNSTVKTTEYDGYEYIIMCSCCDCPPFECPGDNCPTSCDFTVVVTTKERGNVIDYPFHYDKVVYVEDHGGAGLDYRTWNDAIQEAVFETADHDGSGHAAYTDSEWAYGEHEVTKTLKVCKYCNKEK